MCIVRRSATNQKAEFYFVSMNESKSSFLIAECRTAHVEVQCESSICLSLILFPSGECLSLDMRLPSLRGNGRGVTCRAPWRELSGELMEWGAVVVFS